MYGGPSENRKENVSKAQVKEIVRKSVERLYSKQEMEKKKEKKDLELRYDYTADLRAGVHKLDRAIRISMMSTVRTTKNSSLKVKGMHTASYSLQSYDGDTLVSTEGEHEDRLLKTDANQRPSEMNMVNNYQV